MKRMKNEIHEKTNFSLVLHPHRSLGPHAFLFLMIFINLIGFSVGLAFLLMGAWPVLVFFSLVSLFVYFAFKSNYRAGLHREIVEIYEDQLKIRSISPNGQERSRGLQAYWSRLEISGGKLLVFCKSETIEIGKFLIEDEKEQVKEALTVALFRYRNGAAS
ncbi:MAG: DUF2244 domain-containing protein [Sneathiella sp.]|nr:DUF2244 domain-containing protein [Sneathiella sp.]